MANDPDEMKTSLLAILCAVSLLFCVAGLISIAEWTFHRSVFGVLEYPEKQLIALCLSAATALLTAYALRGERAFFRGLRVVAFWVSVVVGLGALLTKAAVSMISADSDIHQWHLMCAWCGGLLLALAITRDEEGR